MKKFKFLFFLPLLFATSLQATELYTTAVQKGLSDMLNPSGKFTTLKFSDGTTQTTASGGAASVAFSEVTGSATSAQLPSTLDVGTISTSQAIKFADNSVQSYASPLLFGTSAVFTATQTTDNTWVAVTGLSLTVTPHSANSKFMLFVNLGLSSDASTAVFYRLMRGVTAIGVGNAAGSRAQITGGSGEGGSNVAVYSVGSVYTDAPGTTSATTYTVQFRSQGAGVNSRVNYSTSDSDADSRPRAISSLNLLEFSN